MSKYNATRIEYKGLVFDSKAEADYFKVLEAKRKAGEIAGIETQTTFILQEGYIDKDGKKVKPITYRCDFEYVTLPDLKKVVVDVKGMATETALLKRKMFKYKYPAYELLWVVKSNKYGTNGWCDYDLLKQKRANARKIKEKELKNELRWLFCNNLYRSTDNLNNLISIFIFQKGGIKWIRRFMRK